jgi:hypothetical protein
VKPDETGLSLGNENDVDPEFCVRCDVSEKIDSHVQFCGALLCKAGVVVPMDAVRNLGSSAMVV